MSDYLELAGQRALVTGGSQGIGEAVVAQLRAAGAKVFTAARSMRPELPYPELFVAADVATVEGCATVARAVHDRLGGVDIIVHVVGGSSAPGGGFAALDDDAWHRALNQNLLPAVRLDRALLPGMLEQGSGVIIHITSIFIVLVQHLIVNHGLFSPIAFIVSIARTCAPHLTSWSQSFPQRCSAGGGRRCCGSKFVNFFL